MANEQFSTWIEEATAAIHQAATLPTFPGDLSLTRQFIDKLVKRLLSTCYNGGEIGSDGCMACRAHRTEETDQKLEGARNLLSQYEATIEAGKIAGEKCRADIQELVEAVEDLEGQKKDLLEDNRLANTAAMKADEELSRVQNQLWAVATERDRLREAADAYSKNLQEQLARNAEFKRLAEALAEV